MAINESGITANQNKTIQCPVCGDPLSLQIASGRKSGKTFLMWKCLRDGRHFRGFITYQPFVESLIQNLENLHGTNK
jgi:ribosomal protein L37AE/L43A